MLRLMTRSKIHNAKITETELYYAGSIGIDGEIIEAVDMLADEWVTGVNCNNGARFETYIIAEAAGSGKICLYGPCARLGEVGDVVHIISYCAMTDTEARSSQMKVAVLGEGNRIETSR